MPFLSFRDQSPPFPAPIRLNLRLAFLRRAIRRCPTPEYILQIHPWRHVPPQLTTASCPAPGAWCKGQHAPQKARPISRYADAMKRPLRAKSITVPFIPSAPQSPPARASFPHAIQPASEIAASETKIHPMQTATIVSSVEASSSEPARPAARLAKPLSVEDPSTEAEIRAIRIASNRRHRHRRPARDLLHTRLQLRCHYRRWNSTLARRLSRSFRRPLQAVSACPVPADRRHDPRLQFATRRRRARPLDRHAPRRKRCLHRYLHGHVA